MPQTITSQPSRHLAPRPLRQAAAKSPARLAAWMAAALCAVFGATTASAAVVFDPQHAGSFQTGSGADATFYQINSDWHGSSVLWDEATQSYGSGVAIGSLPWGTGLWGRADWDTIQATGGGAGAAGAPTILNSWSGLASHINYGNALYNSSYSGEWGAATLLPFFGADATPQENWTAHFSGYIRITDAGNYNFSVLNDDGFFLRLVGAGGSTLEIGRDFLNARDRDGFAEDLQLSEGVYGFELGMWNRLEAGVVDLRWTRPGETDWTLVPTDHLLPVNAIPEPGSLAMLLAGLAILVPLSRRRLGSHRA